jgi:hypothetical protein
MKIIKDMDLERSKELDTELLEKINNYLSSILDQIYSETDPKKLEVLNQKYEIFRQRREEVFRRIERVKYFQSL